MSLGAWLLASGGCTCIIDADKYRGGGGGDDAGGIDGPENLPDAGRPDGRIESDAGPIEPKSAREGDGSGTGAPPVMIVLRDNFEPDTTVRVVRMGDVTDLVVEAAVVSTGGEMLAFGISIPVDPDLDEGDMATLEVYVDEGAGEELCANLTLEGLDEADLSGSVDTTMLRPLYSQVDVTGNVAFTGTAPAILRSTSDITVGSNLIADGKLGGAAGPGGCGGGAANEPGGCDVNGGGAGTSAQIGTGGGGGGHALDGITASGGGAGGQMVGNDLVTPLAGEGGHGGGGGGSGLADLTGGGPGGGGGGIVELTAGGTVMIGGLVDASGGAGTNGADLGCAVAAGGSGGGGSGGAILVRGIALGGAGSLDATRGTGATNCNDGGNGSHGRVRIDVGSEDLPSLAAQPAPVRGPHWADDTEHLVRNAAFTATLYGERNRTFAANLDGGDPEDVETDGSGVGSYSITLEPGHNRICAIVSPTAMLSLPEAVRCHIVTYVP